MKKIFSFMIFYTLIYNLSFSESIFLNKFSLSKSSESYQLYLPKEEKLRLGHELILNNLKDENKRSSSRGKTGAFLIYAGGAAAIVGAFLVTISMTSQDVPTISGGYVGTRTDKQWEHLKTPGIILLGVGVGMMIGGFILRMSHEERKDSLVLSLNPFEEEAAIIYIINF